MRRKITFLRHGKANKAADGQADIERLLSEVGLTQATARRKKMDNPEFDLVLSSPAPRAAQTVAIVAGVATEKVLSVNALYPDPVNDPVGKAIDELFNKPELGYAPIAKYLEMDGEIVVGYGRAAWAWIDSMIQTTDKTNILIGGHAVCLPAIGMAACDSRDLLDFWQILCDLNLGECEGFQLAIEDGKVKSVGIIKD